MPEQEVSFHATYSPDAIRRVAYAIRDLQFRRYGPLLVVACVVNTAAVALLVWFGAVRGPSFYIMVFVVVLGPAWLIYKYTLGPHLEARKLREAMAQTGRVAINSHAVVLPFRSGEVSLAWTTIKAVVENEEFFLLVQSPIAAYFIPKDGMPNAGHDVLRQRVGSKVA